MLSCISYLLLHNNPQTQWLSIETTYMACGSGLAGQLFWFGLAWLFLSRPSWYLWSAGRWANGLGWSHLVSGRYQATVGWVNVGNWNAGFSSFRRLTWASFCTQRQGTKSLIAEAVELLKAQIWDVHDICYSLLIKANHKVRLYSKSGIELYFLLEEIAKYYSYFCNTPYEPSPGCCFCYFLPSDAT